MPLLPRYSPRPSTSWISWSPLESPRRHTLLLVIFVSIVVSAEAVHASDFFPVFPESIDLALAPGETTIMSVSIGVTPLCIRPYLFDVHASDPTALFENLTEPDLNGCGGDVSSFDVEFTGDDAPQAYDLLIVDVYFPESPPFAVAAIPVTIDRVVPEPGLVRMVGAGSMLLVCLRRRRSQRRSEGPGTHQQERKDQQRH